MTRRRLRITSEGPTCRDVKIVDADTGEPFPYPVISAKVEMRVKHENVITLEILGCEIGATAGYPKAVPAAAGEE